MKLFLHKLTHWEYWPFEIVYIPVYFLWMYYALRAKSLFFFNASNPGIKNGGFMMESKKEIYDLIPQKYYPKTHFVNQNTSFDTVLELIKTNQVSFPFIAKPDVGLRGSAVKKIESLMDLQTYHAKANFDYLLQDLIAYPNEVGIFYIRHPNDKEGKITGIVAKEFAIIEGDGKATCLDLIKKNPRYALQLTHLKQEYGKKLEDVLAKGQKLNLVPYGNHARGAKFIDASHWNSPKLTKVINQMCLQIPGFYFGRLDIMYDTWQAFEDEQKFAVVEINGAGSEPTHIYDPKHSLLFAWKTLLKNLSIMYQISAANHKNGHLYLSHKNGMQQYKFHLKQNKKIVHF